MPMKEGSRAAFIDGVDDIVEMFLIEAAWGRERDRKE